MEQEQDVVFAKILVVDDEPDLEVLVRQKFRRKIRRGEYKFIFAQNGVEALKALESEPDTDLVLTDINMPEMDGLTLLSELLGLDLVLRSVVVSAYGDMQNIRTAMNRGAIDFITKPIDFQDLEVTIAKTLEDVLQLKTALEREKQAREALEQLNNQLEARITERTQELEEAKKLPKNRRDLCLEEELGDLLLQVILHAQIASENKDFDFEDIKGVKASHPASTVKEMAIGVLNIKNPDPELEITPKNTMQCTMHPKQVREKLINKRNI